MLCCSCVQPSLFREEHRVNMRGLWKSSLGRTKSPSFLKAINYWYWLKFINSSDHFWSLQGPLLRWLRIHTLFHTSPTPELCTFNPTVWLRILEDDWKRPQQTVHLPHQEPQKNPANILAWDHLQPKSSHLLQPKQHGHHHHAKAMEIDRTCHEKWTW